MEMSKKTIGLVWPAGGSIEDICDYMYIRNVARKLNPSRKTEMEIRLKVTVFSRSNGKR